ncbi:Pol-polyprotein [Rhynchospora pubera]|uniref:Pol-polyprotein n=1 Tax=Rhynchospora pubera TaxID=906938 RepID=A0AAV8HLI2_9POAL|nr:Pol-polyprotein [Rhynchospora pubera]
MATSTATFNTPATTPQPPPPGTEQTSDQSVSISLAPRHNPPTITNAALHDMRNYQPPPHVLPFTMPPLTPSSVHSSHNHQPQPPLPQQSQAPRDPPYQPPVITPPPPQQYPYQHPIFPADQSGIPAQPSNQTHTRLSNREELALHSEDYRPQPSHRRPQYTNISNHSRSHTRGRSKSRSRRSKRRSPSSGYGTHSSSELSSRKSPSRRRRGRYSTSTRSSSPSLSQTSDTSDGRSKPRTHRLRKIPWKRHSSPSPPRGALARHLYRGKALRLKDFASLDKYPAYPAHDARAFVNTFRESMLITGASERTMCLVFPTRLEGVAWEWYAQLPPGSVSSYRDLTTKFLKRFASVRAPPKTCMDLMSIRQHPSEHTRDYLDRFSIEANKCGDYREDMALLAVQRGLLEGPVQWAAMTEKFPDFAAFRERAEHLIRAEEHIATIQGYRHNTFAAPYNRQSTSPRKPQPPGSPRDRQRSRSPRPRRRDAKPSRRNRGRRANSPEDNTPYYKMYHVTTEPQDRVYDRIKHNKEMRRAPPITRTEVFDRNSYCEYHGSSGHRTKDCLKLKDEIERLVRQTNILEHFLAKDDKGKRKMQHLHESGTNADDRRTEHPSNPRPQTTASDRQQRISPPPVMFIEGKATDNPRRQQPFHVLQIEHRSESTQVISFGPHDYDGVQLPHDDAIVLMLRINGIRVKRILVDTGSSADVMYFDALKRMGLGKYPLQPMTTSLVGFTGDKLKPLGTVDLDVSFGDAPRTVVSSIRFIVVDAPSAYNVILGRTSLNSIGAVVSTPHLMIKFPTPQGVGIVRGEQQVAKECYRITMAPQIAHIERSRKHRQFVASLGELNTEPPKTSPTEAMEDTEPVVLRDGQVTQLGTLLPATDRHMVRECLIANKDIFANEDDTMPGINRAIAEHRIDTYEEARPVQQRKRKLGLERRKAVQDEVDRLLKAGAIREVEYPRWLANPVLVRKSNGKWRMCIDYTDLNRACPKKPFPLPSIDAMVDSTAGFKYLSFMDAYSGYNQIYMHPDDEEKTSFITEQGLFCYKVMPFGLKNAGAEYQQMVNKVFKAELGEIIEAYIDDMVVKSCTGEEHVQHLNMIFQRMREVGMRLNPKKSFFCLSSGKFLGYIVSERGIEVHPSKCRAIIDMEAPSTVKEVQELTGRIAALNRFIARSGEVCKPFFQTIKKAKKFEWTSQCQEAFEQIKTYLSSPPIISRPTKGEALYLYVSASAVAVSAALIREEDGVQKPVYFVFKVLRDAEERYSTVEKGAFAVLVAARKLRPYFQAHPIKVLSDLPLRKALGNLDVSGRLLKWAVELSEFDISFLPKAAYKGQVLADFVVESTGRTEKRDQEALWHVHVDGAASERGSGLGIQIKGPKGEVFYYAIHITFPVTNNMVEYEALIAGLRLVEAVGATKVRVYMDSQLVVHQINGQYEVHDLTLAKYLEKAKEVLATFEEATIEHVPRGMNEIADALSKLAKGSDMNSDTPITIMEIPEACITATEPKVLPISAQLEWYTPIWDYLTTGQLPTDKLTARRIKRWAPEFTILEGELLKKGYRKPWLVCISESQGRKLIDEVHGGICGSHQSPYTIDKRIEREGYFWPTMRKDMIDVVRRCERCQYHSRVSRRPPASLHTIASPWPFDVWGIDILGPFPTAKANLRFLVVAVEYFTKWIEAKPLALITSPRIADFVKHNIVYRYGIPHTIISDNGRQFTGAPFQDMCEGFGILSLFSSVSHPQTNGLAEVSNRTILEGLKKKVEGSKGAWPDFLDEILWSYNTTPRTATGRSPFAMVYGMEAVTPMEIVQPTLRTIAYEWTKNNEKKLVELETIYELREEARARMAEYQRKMRKNFDKKVAPKHFQPGDLVLRSVEATGKHIGKLDPAWDGPFIVTRSIEGRAYRLQDLAGRDLPNAWNAVHLRKFYK